MSAGVVSGISLSIFEGLLGELLLNRFPHCLRNLVEDVMKVLKLARLRVSTSYGCTGTLILLFQTRASLWCKSHSDAIELLLCCGGWSCWNLWRARTSAFIRRPERSEHGGVGVLPRNERSYEGNINSSNK
jgi:hypothetical protein